MENVFNSANWKEIYQQRQGDTFQVAIFSMSKADDICTYLCLIVIPKQFLLYLCTSEIWVSQ